jgi:hypothetical protein
MRYVNHTIKDFNIISGFYTPNYWFIVFMDSFNFKPLFLISRCLPNKYAALKVFYRQLNQNKFGILFERVAVYLGNIFLSILELLNILGDKGSLNLLRKERLHTKLKYSRSPAYDMVSGGVAVLFAGLLGFLVSEKFGIELVDSGDFYYVWMYGVFLTFMIKPITLGIAYSRSFLYAVSPRQVIIFFTTTFNVIRHTRNNYHPYLPNPKQEKRGGKKTR